MTHRTGTARAWVAAWLAVGVLQACGGGGGGGGGEAPPPPPPPPPPPAAPTITAQPVNADILQDGTATFTVAATNAASYEWQRSPDGSTWTDVAGGTAATLAVTEPLSASGMHYRAIVAGAGGRAVSAEAALTVRPVMALQPASAATFDGLDVQFSGGPTFDFADASEQWQESRDGLAWSDVAGAHSQLLALHRVALGDNGLQVRMVVTAFGHTYVSNVATLTVTTNPSDPVFVVQPLDATVAAGGDARFSAWVAGFNLAGSEQWQTSTDRGAHWDDVPGGNLQALVLSGVGASADGEQVRQKVTSNGIVATSQVATLHVGTAGAGRLDLLAGVIAGVGDIDATGTAAWLRGEGSPGFDANGNLFVLDSVRFKRIDASGRVTSLAGRSDVAGSYDGLGGAAMFNGQLGSATVVSSSGDAFVAETTSGRIRRIAPDGTVSTFAGSQVAGSADGTGTAASFNSPRGLAIDASDNLYVADTGNHTIRRITPAGVVTTIAGMAGVSGSIDGAAGVARLNMPWGIAVDSQGVVSFTDSSTAVRQWSATAGVTTLAGTANASGAVDATGAAARFNRLTGLAVDASRTLYVADTGNATIRQVTPAGVVSTYLGTAGLVGHVDATGSSARFTAPFAVAVAPNGTLAVADGTSVRRVSGTGAVTTLAGSVETQGQADGVGAQATFDVPQSATTDAAGNVYVGDGHGILRKIGRDGTTSTSASGGFVSGVVLDDAGNFIVADGTFDCVVRRVGPAGAIGVLAGDSTNCARVDGNGSHAAFYKPHAIARGRGGEYFVLDGQALRRISPTGDVTTLTSTVQGARCAEGSLATISFCAASGLVADAAGNLFVADGSVVWRVDATTQQVTLLAGSLTSNQVSLDGSGADARFMLLEAIARDAAGNLYVADFLASNVRRIDPAGNVTTLLGRAGFDGIVLGTAPALYRPQALAMMDATHLAVTSEDAVLVYTLPGGTPLATAAASRGAAKAKTH